MPPSISILAPYLLQRRLQVSSVSVVGARGYERLMFSDRQRHYGVEVGYLFPIYGVLDGVHT